MAAKILYLSLELEPLCFMFDLKERPYSAHVLISFWCDSDNKNCDFFYVSEF